MMQHVFSGNPLQRGEAERRDEAWLAEAAAQANARYLMFEGLNVALDDAGALAWFDRGELDDAAIDGEPVFLGLDNGQPHFVAATSQAEALPRAVQMSDCRAAAMQLPIPDTGILAQARAQLDWHRRHGFCSVCGTPTNMGRGGQVRLCPNCGAHHFPRTDPVAIMLVIDGDRCLVGQPKGPLVRTGIYSALAGFIDQGESIEEAVRREVMEEAGIEVGDVRYHSSQPWPFPSSLMIGCHAVATTNDIQMDTEEMHDVRWVSRAEMERAMAGEPAEVKAPGPIAIAHHLIASWLDGTSGL